MLKNFFLIFLLFCGELAFSSEILNFNINNKDLKIVTEEGIRIEQEGSYYSGKSNEPFLPILSYFFEIPEFTKVESITISPQDLKDVKLTNPLLHQPEQVIMSRSDYQPIDLTAYEGTKFPQEWLFNKGSSIAGSKNIAFLAVYTCAYDPSKISLSIPESFKVQVSLTRDDSAKKLPDSVITNKIHHLLNLAPQREFQQEKYLLIYPQSFADAYSYLVTLRENQGLNVITAEIEEIQANSPGTDLAEKVRNYIKEVYLSQGLDYVTLGGDINYIPTRVLWAFDCNYGIDNENNIQADMYYANLNGNWNANENGLYGEDEDNVDLFPEVVVSRIPITYTADDVWPVLEKITNYENATAGDYSQGLGLSQDLWPEANSVYTQEYMEEMYYPDFINNIILSGEENNVTLAQENFNRNPSIIQHTGHCFWNVIALENGLINAAFVNNMTNDYAGAMYSIGCWAGALDYLAISKSMVTLENHGLTAFVGNSRYGWGAPSAAGFGFSEFFQKVFSKLVFEDGITNIAMANQLQKIPFVAYHTGDSVYKWCSYQLNTFGDSYFRIFTEEPKQLQASYSIENNNCTIFISSDNEPVEDAVVYLDDDTIHFSDHNGRVDIYEYIPTICEIYKYGYEKTVLVVMDEDELAISDFELPDLVTPLSDRTMQIKLKNNTDTNKEWQLLLNENEAILGQVSGTLNANSISDWISLEFNQPQQSNIVLELYSEADQLVDTKYLLVELAQPIVEISNLTIEQYPLSPGQSNSLAFNIQNMSAFPISDIILNYISPELTFTNPTSLQPFSLQPGQIIPIENLSFSLNQESEYAELTIEGITENEYWTLFPNSATYYLSVAEENLDETFEQDPAWLNQTAWHTTDVYGYQSDYSLTCTPEVYGEFDLDLPLVTYSDDLTISFMYKYKMPMYGEDGISIYIINQDLEERIIFLGSGGALDNYTSQANDFVFSDWAEYNLTLGELLLNKPELGEEITIRFSFTYINDPSINNDYPNIPELGIFLDNLQLNFGNNEVQNDTDVEELNKNISIYPNPISNSQLNLNHNTKVGERYEISVYNLKGQQVETWQGTINAKNNKTIQLPLFQKNRNQITSGVYFLKYKTIDTSEVKKILFLK